MKLPHKKSGDVAVLNWHPDFRDVTALPDLKVVRTSFIVNFLCITLASVTLLWTAFREYKALSLQGEIRAAQESTGAKQARNAELLAQNKEFLDAQHCFVEAEKFLQAPFAASELLMALARSLPTNMDFTSIAYDNNAVTLKGTIRGAPETASTRVSAYQDTLRTDPYIGPLFPDVSLTSLLRDPRTQGLSFEIALKRAMPPAAEPVKGRGKGKGKGK